MAKDRTPIPSDVAVEVLFQQDHTCCVCRERGKTVQIHHIDETPTNHSISNLAVLCFEDHARTQTKGGFGRKLLASEVRRYRDDWIERVKKRRYKADKLMIAAMGGSVVAARQDTEHEWAAPPFAQLIAYVEHLPRLRRAAYENAYYGWDTGVTAEMRRANAEVVDIMERVLDYLANWYPPNHFSERGSTEYFSEFIASRYHWHRALHEPEGPGSGGTLAGVLAGGGAMTDIEAAVVDMVEALSVGELDMVKWRKAWKKAEVRPSSRMEQLRALWNRVFGTT
jgi:hypothetical protein